MLLPCSVLTRPRFRSLCRDELMAEVGGGMDEDAARGGDPSIGRRRYGPKSRRRHGPKSLDMPHLLCRLVLFVLFYGPVCFGIVVEL